MSCAWPAATRGASGIIRNSKRFTITCCAPPRPWSPRARSPNARWSAASTRTHRAWRRLCGAGGFVHTGRTDARSRGACAAEAPAIPSLAIWCGAISRRPALFRSLRQARRTQGLVRASRRDASAQAGRTGYRTGRARAWHHRSKGFRDARGELGLTDRILQIPFLPHWRVPEFLRGCLAVCCLEQDFPIVFHTPIIPREVLLCGTCLVGSTEVIRKLPGYERLPHGYGCVAIEDVNDVDARGTARRDRARSATRRRGRGAGRDFALSCSRESISRARSSAFSRGLLKKAHPQTAIRPSPMRRRRQAAFRSR